MVSNVAKDPHFKRLSLIDISSVGNRSSMVEYDFSIPAWLHSYPPTALQSRIVLSPIEGQLCKA